MSHTGTTYKQTPRTNRKHKVNFKQYIAHDDEPDSRIVDYIEPEIEEALMQNRTFLKQRVWRNARKFRRPSSDLF